MGHYSVNQFIRNGTCLFHFIVQLKQGLKRSLEYMSGDAHEIGITDQ